MSTGQPEALDLADMQGLIVRGYGGLPEAALLLLQVSDRLGAAGLLQEWAGTLSSAQSQPRDSAMQVALTADGIEALVGPAIRAGFSEQFSSGMVTTYRSRLLGDEPETWAWGGPTTPAVHLLVLLYARTSDEIATFRSATLARCAESGLSLVAALDTHTLGEREPFGFHDGISQPMMTGLPQAVGSADAVRAGEFVLGYLNEYGQRSDRPLLAATEDPEGVLPRDADGSGAADLGRNGTYLVLRQLDQDVAGFHAFLDRATRDSDGRSDPQAAARLGAKMVGRWPSGAPLVLDPDRDDPEHGNRNDFGYFASDPAGLACPVGAHIRRANPRDSLEPGPGTARSLAINHRHRILRRGRGYAPAHPGDAGAQGIYFICLNANLARQFEFIQHSWLDDPGFKLLDDATDPLVGARNGQGGTFTEPRLPLRRRYRDLPQFVQVRGGAYFFLPGISALRYLAARAARDGGRT